MEGQKGVVRESCAVARAHGGVGSVVGDWSLGDLAVGQLPQAPWPVAVCFNVDN